MRLAATLDPTQFSEAERSALRLDGDAFALGDTVVPIDVPMTPGVRAASIAARSRVGLVAAGRTAAWIHGAEPTLRHPHDWTTDIDDPRATRAPGPTRAVRYGRLELMRLGDVTVTTPIRTAFDLVRLEALDDRTAAVCRRLLALTGLEPAAVRRAATAFPGSRNKLLAIERLTTIAEG